MLKRMEYIMKGSFKPYIRVVVFIAGLILIISSMDFLFGKTGYVRYTIKEVNAKDENYDTLVLGASHARSAINPYKIDEQTGSNCYNLAVPGALVRDTYYLLLDAIDSNDIKTVIYDVDFYYWIASQNVEAFSKDFIYQPMTDMSVKTRYVFDNIDNIDIRNFVTNRLSWDMSMETAKKNVNKKTSKAYKENSIEACDTGDDGYVLEANGPYVGKGYFSRVVSGLKPGGQDFIENEKERANGELIEDVLNYFDKIVELCNKNNIELICIVSPITPSSMETMKINIAYPKIQQYLDTKGIKLYDFNLLLQSVLPRDDVDYGDLEGHMGGTLGDEYSQILGKCIREIRAGSFDKSRYFYNSYDEMFKNLKTDYVKATGNEWEGY